MKTFSALLGTELAASTGTATGAISPGQPGTGASAGGGGASTR